MMEELLPSYMT